MAKQQTQSGKVTPTRQISPSWPKQDASSPSKQRASPKKSSQSPKKNASVEPMRKLSPISPSPTSSKFKKTIKIPPFETSEPQLKRDEEILFGKAQSGP